jgi:hypothetical protein
VTPQAYQVQLSRADYAVGLSAVIDELARLDTARGRLLFGRLAVSIVTLSVVAFAFPYSFPGLIVAGLLIWLGDFLVQTAFKTQTVGVSFDPEAHANARIEFTDDEIVEHGDLRTRRWTWDAVRRVHISPGHTIIELKGWDMIVLPDRLWPTQEERTAFRAELEARRRAGDTRRTIPSACEAEARVVLIEPVLLARISLVAAAFQLIFELSLPIDKTGDRSATFATALGAALLGAAVLWWISGKAFSWLATRSPVAALRTGWGLFLLLTAALLLWCFGLI